MRAERRDGARASAAAGALAHDERDAWGKVQGANVGVCKCCEFRSKTNLQITHVSMRMRLNVQVACADALTRMQNK